MRGALTARAEMDEEDFKMPPIHVKVPTEGEEGEIDGPLEGVEDRMVGTGAHHAHGVHPLVELVAAPALHCD